MDVQEILDGWKEDSKIDSTDLTAEGQKIYLLHSKYLDLWSKERLRLKSLELQEKLLKLEKYEFLLQGPSKESKEKGWEYPVSGKVLRQDVDIYRDADKQVQEITAKIEIQRTKVDTLKMILDSINQRTYILNGLIKYDIFKGGM